MFNSFATGGARTRFRKTGRGVMIAVAFLTAVVPPSGAQPRKPAVDAAVPLSRQIRERDQYNGRFEAVKRVELRARVSGYLKSIHFADGQVVKQGDLLFVIDPRPFEAQVAAARATLASAKAQLRLADLDLKRGEELLTRRATPAAEVDRRRSQRDVASANVLVALANFREAELNLEYTNVRAPIGGRVSDRRVDVGNLIAGGNENATLLTTLVALDPIHFIFDVSEQSYLRYARQAKDGTRQPAHDSENPVYIRLADETGWPHRGVMNFVDNEIGRDTGTIRIRARIENPDGFLQPGMFGEIRIPGSGPYEALLVPDGAVLADQSDKIVMVVGKDDRIAVRRVDTGPIVDGLRVIRKGLSADDRVVVNGVQRVRQGMEVAVRAVKIAPRPESVHSAPQGGPGATDGATDGAR